MNNLVKNFFPIFKRTLLTESSRVVKLRKLEAYEAISVIEFDNRENKNALSKKFVKEMTEILHLLKNDSNVRAVILRSLVPGLFCAGADLKERRSLSEAEVRTFVTDLRNMNSDLENLSMPVIAAIDGVALGGGLEMALACDMRISTEDAKMGLVETRLAILPGSGGTQRLPRLINPAIAKELIFTAKIFDGLDAKHYGIVNHSVKQNETMDAAFKKAVVIARRILPNGPIGVQMAKLAINKGLQVDIKTGCAIEDACYAQVIPTKDRLEGLQAFQEKRNPIYKGE